MDWSEGVDALRPCTQRLQEADGLQVRFECSGVRCYGDGLYLDCLALPDDDDDSRDRCADICGRECELRADFSAKVLFLEEGQAFEEQLRYGNAFVCSERNSLLPVYLLLLCIFLCAAALYIRALIKMSTARFQGAEKS